MAGAAANEGATERENAGADAKAGAWAGAKAGAGAGACAWKEPVLNAVCPPKERWEQAAILGQGEGAAWEREKRANRERRTCNVIRIIFMIVMNVFTFMVLLVWLLCHN